MHSILSHHHSLKHVIPLFLKGTQTSATTTWNCSLCNNSSVSSKCFPSDPSHCNSFINFGPKTLPIRSSLWKWWVQFVVLIDLQAQAPPVDGHTVAWWIARWRIILPLKGSLDHFVWGCFGIRGVQTPRKTAAKKTPIRWWRLGSGSSLQYLFLSFLLDHCFNEVPKKFNT